MSTVLIRQRKSRRNRHVGDPSMRPSPTNATLTFSAAGTVGLTVTSNMPLIVAAEAGFDNIVVNNSAGTLVVSSITLTTPTTAVVHTTTSATGGTLTVGAGALALRTLQGGVVNAGSFH